MARDLNESREFSKRELERMPGGRSMRGATPAQKSRRLDTDTVQPGILYAPNLSRAPGSLEPNVRTLPSMPELRGMSKDQLAGILGDFGITKPWTQNRAENVGYLMRMTTMPPGSPQFKDALDKLINQESERSLIGSARSAYHEYMAWKTDTSGELVRVAENDQNTCEVCNALAGEVGTIDYHKSIGMPGASSCDGGSLCRCVLLAVS